MARPSPPIAAPKRSSPEIADPERQLIAMHGWAGDANSWAPWRAATADRPWRWCCGERGYGGNAPTQPGWGARGRRVVVAHSLGPHLLPAEVLASAEAVVLLASFGRFVPEGRAGRRLATALAGMEGALTDGADISTDTARARAMLRAFLARAAAPDPESLLPAGPADAALGPLERRRLRDDLTRLASCAGLPAGFPDGVPVLLVEAGADAIVVPEARALLRESLPGADRLVFPEAGHALLRAPVIAAVLEWLERTLPAGGPSAFTRQVRLQFGSHAAHYEQEARLQQAVAWRLARLGRSLTLTAGPCADLGAGSGLLSRALTARHPGLALHPPQQLDLCPELLARNPLPQRRLWDLNTGLPADLDGASLLASSFALQWLERPTAALRLWCRFLAPGGWLLLALPTAGSFPQWRDAARAAAVPCTALALPSAEDLLAAAREEGLALHQALRLRFSRPGTGGKEGLRALRRLGAGASPSAPLSAGELRRLLRHWPTGSSLTWEVLLLVGRRPGNTDSGGTNHGNGDAGERRCGW